MFRGHALKRVAHFFRCRVPVPFPFPFPFRNTGSSHNLLATSMAEGRGGRLYHDHRRCFFFFSAKIFYASSYPKITRPKQHITSQYAARCASDIGRLTIASPYPSLPTPSFIFHLPPFFYRDGSRCGLCRARCRNQVRMP